LRGAIGEYDEPEYVRIELMYARKIFSENPDWSIINVTSKPIEEIASEILTIKSKKKSRK
jgi:regulator of PEP synthase PpsR (kinase-PPPase family)